MPLFLTYIVVSAVAVPATGVQGGSRLLDYCGGCFATWSSAEGETLPATTFSFLCNVRFFTHTYTRWDILFMN